MSKVQEKISDALTGISYATSATGAGVGFWLQENWLMVLSGIGVVVTIYFQWRQDRRQRELLELKRDAARKDS